MAAKLLTCAEVESVVKLTSTLCVGVEPTRAVVVAVPTVALVTVTLAVPELPVVAVTALKVPKLVVKLTTAPETSAPVSSFTVAVKVLIVTPSAGTLFGDATKLVTRGPALLVVKVTVVVLAAVVPTAALTVAVPVVVLVKKACATLLEVVVNVCVVDPLSNSPKFVVNCTETPEPTGLPYASVTVAVNLL